MWLVLLRIVWPCRRRAARQALGRSVLPWCGRSRPDTLIGRNDCLEGGLVMTGRSLAALV